MDALPTRVRIPTDPRERDDPFLAYPPKTGRLGCPPTFRLSGDVVIGAGSVTNSTPPIGAEEQLGIVASAGTSELGLGRLLVG